MLLLVCPMLDYRLLKESLNIITIDGPTVAIKKDRKSKDCEINVGNISLDIIIPTSKLFEKSGEGNKRNPQISPHLGLFIFLVNPCLALETYLQFSHLTSPIPTP